MLSNYSWFMLVLPSQLDFRQGIPHKYTADCAGAPKMVNGMNERQPFRSRSSSFNYNASFGTSLLFAKHITGTQKTLDTD